MNRTTISTTYIQPSYQDSNDIIIRGYLDELNYGAPKSPNIITETKKGSQYIPQAWCYISNNEEKWFYNFQGGLEEERYLRENGLNVFLPTIEELLFIYKKSINKILQEENKFLTGIRGANTGKLLKVGKLGGLWSSSFLGGEDHAYGLLINSDNTPNVKKNIEYKGIGLPIRFLKKEK